MQEQPHEASCYRCRTCRCRFNDRFAGTSVGVSIGINQPGVYGRIDIGNMPPPVVVYPQPVVVAPTPVAIYQQPIYVYVPPAHQENWARYCGRYSACGQPVYFVHESWVRENDHRRYRGHEDQDGDRGRREGHKHHDD
jgi:hypothetical protein